MTPNAKACPQVRKKPVRRLMITSTLSRTVLRPTWAAFSSSEGSCSEASTDPSSGERDAPSSAPIAPIVPMAASASSSTAIGSMLARESSTSHGSPCPALTDPPDTSREVPDETGAAPSLLSWARRT